MKKSAQFNVRVPPDEWEAFQQACAASGEKSSAVIRSLCKAAVQYMAIYCAPRKQWYPPKLSPDIPVCDATDLPLPPDGLKSVAQAEHRRYRAEHADRVTVPSPAEQTAWNQGGIRQTFEDRPRKPGRVGKGAKR